jgi:hypothetical protein
VQYYSEWPAARIRLQHFLHSCIRLGQSVPTIRERFKCGRVDLCPHPTRAVQVFGSLFCEFGGFPHPPARGGGSREPALRVAQPRLFGGPLGMAYSILAWNPGQTLSEIAASHAFPAREQSPTRR